MKVFFLVLVYVFNLDLYEFSAAILEKGLLCCKYCVIANNTNKIKITNEIVKKRLSRSTS